MVGILLWRGFCNAVFAISLIWIIVAPLLLLMSTETDGRTWGTGLLFLSWLFSMATGFWSVCRINKS